MITSADVSEAIFEGRQLLTANFDGILSVSFCNTFYWGAGVNELPENGTLIFDEPYVLIGLTSAGDNVTNVTYVNSFLLSYSATLNGTFETLVQVYYCKSKINKQSTKA